MYLPEQLFGEGDTLAGLVHPITGKGYHYANDRTILSWARALASAICRSGLEVVVISETGASPLAEIIEEIFLSWGETKQFVRVKFPREPMEDIFPVLAHYVTSSELDALLEAPQLHALKQNPLLPSSGWPDQVSRRAALHIICRSMPNEFWRTGTNVAEILNERVAPVVENFCDAVRCVLSGSIIFETLSQPFIYLDEYIDSGTTLRNAHSYLNCISQWNDFLIAAYYINVAGAKDHPRILHTCFSGTDRPGCYESGAYPYENRVDLIGHFYAMTPGLMVRQMVEPIGTLQPAPLEQQVEDTIALLYTEAKKQLVHLRSCFALDQVASYVTEHHLVRYYIWCLEKSLGDPVLTEFSFELFDMYGPAWSPMPTSLHLDYWAAFEKFGNASTTLDPRVIEFYARSRKALLGDAARLCAGRRQAWKRRMIELLEDENENTSHIIARASSDESVYQWANNRYFDGAERADGGLGSGSPAKAHTSLQAT